MCRASQIESRWIANHNIPCKHHETMGMFVDVDHVTTVIDETGKNWGTFYTDSLKDAVQKLPVFVPGQDVPSPSEAAVARSKAFSRVRMAGEDLSESLGALADYVRDADVTEVASLQQMAKMVSDNVEKLVNLKDGQLMKQLQSIRASKN